MVQAKKAARKKIALESWDHIGFVEPPNNWKMIKYCSLNGQFHEI